MNIAAVNVSLAVPENMGGSNVVDTKNILNNSSSFADTLGDATTAIIKDKPVLDRVKSILSQAGFTQDEIDSVKNLKDLKTLLESKVKDGTLKTGDDLTNLLSMIGAQLTGKAQQNFTDIKDLLNSVIPQIKTAVSKLVSSGGTVDALKTFQDETNSILSSNKQAIESLKPEDLKLFKSALANEINNSVSSSSTDLSISIQNEIKSMLDKYASDKSASTLLDSTLPQLDASVAKVINSGATPTPDAQQLAGEVQNSVSSAAPEVSSNIDSSTIKLTPSLPVVDLSALSNQGEINVNTLLDSTLPQLDASVTKAVNSGATPDAMLLLQNETNNILGSNKQAIESLSPDDLKSFKAQLAGEVNNISSSAAPEVSSKIAGEISSILDSYKTDTSTIKLNVALPDVKITQAANLQDLQGGNLGDKSSSDNSILSKLIEPSKDSSSIDKATNFMTQFTSAIAPVKVDAPANLTININNVNADIVKSLNYMQQGDIKNLTVTITPKELGTVIINLIMQNGTMVASITASSKEAYNLINANMPDISAKLQNLNIAVQDLSLNIYNQDTTFFKDGSRWQQQQQQQQNNQNGNRNSTSTLNETENIANQSLVNNNVDILA